MKVYFSHGKESGPWGSKIRRLASIASEHGCEVDSVDYTDLNSSDLNAADLRVERLLGILKNEVESFILVGSSMGGYVSLVASGNIQTHAVFLLAPALYIQNYRHQIYHSTSEHIEVVHGWSDEEIPPEHSIKFAKEADCTLHLISGDHRLNESIETVEELFNQFLHRVLVTQ